MNRILMGCNVFRWIERAFTRFSLIRFVLRSISVSFFIRVDGTGKEGETGGWGGKGGLIVVTHDGRPVN